MGKISFEEIMAKADELDAALDSFDEELDEAKKKKKKPYDSASITTGNIGYNIAQFNKHMGTAFPGNDNSNPSTEEAKAAAKAAETAAQDLGGGEAATGAGEGTASGGEASTSSGDAGSAGVSAGDGGASGGMGESLEEDLNLMEGAILNEERILIPKLVKNGIAEANAYIELPDGVHVLPREQVSEALTKLSPAEEFIIGYITPVYFYKELWDLFNVVKCTEFIGYTGMDYRQVRDETRAEYDTDRDSRLDTAKSQIDNPEDIENKFVKRIDSQDPKAYGQINKTVVQKQIDKVDYDSILYYPAPGKKPKVCYYIDIHDGKGYAKVSRALFEKTVVAYVEGALKSGQLIGSNRWNIDKLKAKVTNTLAVDKATTGKDALGAQKLWEPTATDIADKKVFKPQVRALYTNQVYYLSTPYDTLGTPLNPSLLEDVELAEDAETVVDRLIDAELNKDLYEELMTEGKIKDCLKRLAKAAVVGFMGGLIAGPAGAITGAVTDIIKQITSDVVDWYKAKKAKDELAVSEIEDEIADTVGDESSESVISRLRQVWDSLMQGEAEPELAMAESIDLDEAKRETRRYYIRPQGIFCANKSEVIRGLISVGDENCCVYSLKGLGDNRDVHKLTNKDIIYYYDDGILYDKNHVKVMDYDLYIKHEEERKKFPGNVDNVSGSAFIDEYDDRITDVTGPGIEESIGKSILEFWDIFDEKPADQAPLAEELNESVEQDDPFDAFTEELHEEAETHVCCICGDEFVGYGNNPEPVKSFDDGVCCDACNIKFVIPARLANFNKNIK